MIKYKAICVDANPYPSMLTKNKIYEVSSRHWNQDGTKSDRDKDEYHHGIIDMIDVICDDGSSRSFYYTRFRDLAEIRDKKLEKILE